MQVTNWLQELLSFSRKLKTLMKIVSDFYPRLTNRQSSCMYKCVCILRTIFIEYIIHIVFYVCVALLRIFVLPKHLISASKLKMIIGVINRNHWKTVWFFFCKCDSDIFHEGQEDIFRLIIFSNCSVYLLCSNGANN